MTTIVTNSGVITTNSNSLTDAATKATAANEFRFGTDAQISSATNGALAKLAALEAAALTAQKYGYGKEFTDSVANAFAQMTGNFSSPNFSAKPASKTNSIA